MTAVPRAPTRTVMMVAYFFPPLGGVGVQRTLKFATYLGRFGWRPIVLTPRTPAYSVRDESLAAEMPPSLQVERSFCPEPSHVPALAARALGALLRRDAGSFEQDATPIASGTRPTKSMATLAGRGADRPGPIHSTLRSAGRLWARFVGLVFFPDERVPWFPFAVRSGVRVARGTGIDAIYSSSPPITTHLIARSLAGRLGRPWVADFRDPWIGNAFARPPSRARRWLQIRLERAIVRAADQIVVASPSMLADFQRRHPERAERFVCIPNGYDRADLSGLPRMLARTGDHFRLVYAGSVYGDRELDLFLAGVELLIRRRPEVRDRLHIEFVGWLNVRNQRVAAAYAEADRLGGVVSYTGFLPRRETLARMASADALLQIIADDPGKEVVVGAKLPEYLAFNLPILAVVPEGDARRLLEELEWGIAVDPRPDAVAAGLERLLVSPRPDRPADPSGRYDRVAQTGHLAGILDDAVAETR